MIPNYRLISGFRRLLFCLLLSFLTGSNVNASDNSTMASSQFSGEDFSHWLEAAYIADATYKSRQDIEQVLASQGYTVDQFKQLQGFSVGYVIATNDKSRQHIIAVRGTSNMENIVVDAAFVLLPDKITGVDIHQGFLLSARDIYQQILPELTPGYTINTIGHSLGGAAALIIAMMLDAQGHTVGEVITFGQPKVTNISGSRTFKHLDVIRLVNPKDIVPLVPPLDPMEMMNLSIFWHQGTEIVLFKNNQYSVLSGIDSMMRATDFLNDMPGEQHINNHFMSTYITHLKSKQVSAEQIAFKSDFKFSDWFSPSSGKSK